MIRIESTTNRKEIEEFLFDPDIHDALIPDDSLKPGDKKLLELKIKFFIVSYDSIHAAIFLLMPLDEEAAALNLGIKKQFRGKIGYEICKKMADFMRSVLGFTYILGRIRHTNRKSMIFARQMGFKPIGANSKYQYMGVNYG